jgi:hypothetical protein
MVLVHPCGFVHAGGAADLLGDRLGDKFPVQAVRFHDRGRPANCGCSRKGGTHAALTTLGTDADVQTRIVGVNACEPNHTDNKIMSV